MSELEILVETPPTIQVVAYVPPDIQVVSQSPPDVQVFQTPTSVVQVGVPGSLDEDDSSAEVITIPFFYGDASPKPIATIAAGKTVFTATIVIQTPFNGTAPSLAMGDGAMNNRLIRSDQNDPTFPAEYEVSPAHTYSAQAQILLTITPGEGCTQGSGYVLLEV